MALAGSRGDALVADALATRPPLVGITTMTSTVPETLRIAGIAKQLSPSSVVVVGGVHPTIAPRDLISNSSIDYVLRGEADVTLVGLADAVLSGGRLPRYADLLTREDQVREISRQLPARVKLDDLHFPAFDLVDLAAYEQPITVVTSRGCPFECIYCSAGQMSRGWRGVSVERVLDDIERLVVEFGVRRVSFSDDLFTLNGSRVEAICGGLIRRGIEIPWGCLARPDRVTSGLLRRMRDAGCARIYFGAESASQSTLEFAGRRYTPDVVEKAISMARSVGIEHVLASFVIGFPEETREDVMTTLRFADSLDAFIQVHALTPFPGTPLARHLRALGITIRDTDYSHFTCQYAVIDTPNLRREDLQELLTEGLMLCCTHNRDRTAAL